MEERVINVDYGDEMRKAYIDYSMSVITARALPDVRDGLKPVHRRILYAMKQLNLEPSGPFRKSARIVGDCLGKYHPHGDSSVYDAMVRLSQPFNMSMPLISGQGNFGSIDGDGAAAMRYTEAKLQPLANELLSDLDKRLVDFVPNFDNSLTEPVVLPAKFPNLLVNGAMGIAVGMSTSIPPHNINEVIKATLKLIDDPALSLKQLTKIIKGPDFPTGGIISNQDELYDIYATGAGKIKVRAKMEIEDMGYGKNAIIITEIPYTLSGSKSKLIEDIAALIVDKKLPEASDIRDESSREGMRIVIETKKGTNLEIFKNKLLKMTKLEDTFGVNLLALSQNKPIVFNLKQLLEEYIAFLKETTLKRINYELKKATDKFEVLDGLISAIDVIDLIIEIIRNSKDVASVRACLIQGETGNIGFKTKKSENEAKKLKFSERQADAILSMQLQRLVGLELEKLKEEAMNTERDIVFYRDLIKYEKKFNEYMKEDLERINQAYKVKRRTELSNLEIGEMEEEIKEENLYALLDNNNYLKIIDSQSFSRAATETLSDFRIVPITNMEKLGIFDWDGNLHSIKIGELPVSKINDKGQPLENLTKKSSIRVLNMINLTKSNRENLNLLFVTRAGLVKRVPASEYETNRTTISATKINNNGDFLIDVKLLEPEHHEILLTTKEKRTLRFLLDEIPVLKKNSLGVTGMNINAYDDLEKVFIDGKTKEAKRKRGSKGKI